MQTGFQNMENWGSRGRRFKSFHPEFEEKEKSESGQAVDRIGVCPLFFSARLQAKGQIQTTRFFENLTPSQASIGQAPKNCNRGLTAPRLCSDKKQ